MLLFVLFAERITQTVEITKHTVDIEEKGVKLKLTIVDTPGFGDAVNNTEWYVFISKTIQRPRIQKRIHRVAASKAERPGVFLLQLEVGGRLHRSAV